MKILIVEDDKSIGQALQISLKDATYNAMQSFYQNDLLLVQQRLESLQQGMKRMKVLVSQLLNLAHMQGTSTSQFREVNIPTVSSRVFTTDVLAFIFNNFTHPTIVCYDVMPWKIILTIL